MKHAFLRRLGALALALVMAASLYVPAWADDPYPALNTELIVFKDFNDSQAHPYTLKVENVEPGDVITWTAENNVTLSGGTLVSSNTYTTTVERDTVNNVLTGDTIQVSTSADTQNGKITVQVRRATSAHGSPLTCYVYSKGAPYNVTPSPDSQKKLPDLTCGTVNNSYELHVTFPGNSINLKPDDVEFRSSVQNLVEVGTVQASGNRFSTTLTAIGSVSRPTPVIITMILKNGGYSDEWTLTVNPAPDTIPVESVSISPKGPLYMVAGDTRDALTATVSPSNATDKTVTWHSDDESVVRVDENTGKIIAVSEGRATVYAKADGVKSSNCVIYVSAAPSSVTLDQTTLQLDLTKSGQKTAQLTATPAPASGVTVTSYSWRTTNSAVVDFDGKSTVTGYNSTVTVTGKKEGTAVITVTVTFTDAKGGKTTKDAQCSVTVLDKDSKPVDVITLSEAKHSMPEDGSFNLSVTSFNPSNVLDKSIKWEIVGSSDVVTLETVNQTTVKVKGAKPGTAQVMATANFGAANEICAVTVTPKAEGISLVFNFDTNPAGTNQYTYTFKKNGDDYINVNARLSPTAAEDPIRWTSKNPAVATVSTGTGTRAAVTAVGPGTTDITAAPMDPAGKDREGVTPAKIKVTVSGLSIVRTVDGTTGAVTSLSLSEGQRVAVSSQAFGSAYNGDHSCDWSSSDPSIVQVGTKAGVSTTLTGRRPGTAIVTARKGTYSADCTVTVGEDNSVVITASTAPGSPLQFSTLAGQLQGACSNKTGSSLSYISNLAVASTDQGILHDQHHSSADTGAGVGVQDQYYPGAAPQGKRSLNDLSFVPRNTFSGTAEITYTGRSANNKSFNGTIRVTVNGTGDVMYASGEGSPVTFLADDFNRYHPNFQTVSFTPPLDTRGTLYYNYTSPSQPGTKVASGDKYYRTGTPGVDKVTFVPARGFTGTVTIAYKGTDTGSRSFTGTVTVTVNGGGSTAAPGDIYYPFREDSWTTFQAADFQRASQTVLGESLSYVRFELPPSSEGTLFYNYRGFGNYDSAVRSTTSYYYGGTPALSGVTFVPTTTSPTQVDIGYTGYTTRGNTFTGTIHIGQENDVQQNGLRYTVFTGKSVYFNGYDFNAACIAATGASLNYVQFSPLPAVSQGALRYTRGNSSTTYNLATSTRCYRSASNTGDVQLSNVSFLASSGFTGTVTIPFTGYNTNNTSFTGQVVISVTPPTAGDSVFTATTASPIRLSSYRMQSICAGALDKDLSYITFTSLPSAAAGRLYLGYNGFGTGSQVNTGTRYYVSSYPGIDQLSFVPRGRYNGQVTVGYTATDTAGKTASGILTFNISSSGGSNYFNDLGGHAWAAPAVDYLYQNGVTKGTTPATFGPDQRILRCDFVLMLCRAFGFGENGSGYSFADVPADAYYAGAVAVAKQKGIISGDGRSFNPNGELTRQDAMVMIYNSVRAAGWSVSPSTSILGRFPDGVSVSSYARDAVSTLVQLGAVNGDNGRLYPHNPITRAEAAMILHFVMTS